MSVAFIGLGAMGAPMAENLVKRQFRVTGFDMRESARADLAAAGGHAADSAAALNPRSHDAANLKGRVAFARDDLDAALTAHG